MQEDRLNQTRKNLERIHARKGTIYTLGLLMGIISRLTRSDYDLYKEIEIRAKRAEQDDS
jgi:hypothetical protein